MSKPKLLVVEDDPALCAQYKWGFPAWRVLIANDRAEAEAAARREQPAVVLLDLGLPPDAEGVAEGFATLETLRKLAPTMPVVVSSGQDHRDNMLRAIALGAYDFCEKPADLALLRTVLDRALRLRELEEENLRLAAQPRPSPIRDILTADEAMLKVCRTVERLASVSVPVLLLGRVLNFALMYIAALVLQLPAGFVAGLSLLSGWPGIILMLVVVPPLVRIMKKGGAHGHAG